LAIVAQCTAGEVKIISTVKARELYRAYFRENFNL